MRFREIPLQLDRALDVIDRPCEERRVRLVTRARHLVLKETRIGETYVGERITRIQHDGALKIGDRAWHERRVERLEPHASFRESLVRLEAAGLAVRAPGGRISACGSE